MHSSYGTRAPYCHLHLYNFEGVKGRISTGRQLCTSGRISPSATVVDMQRSLASHPTSITGPVGRNLPFEKSPNPRLSLSHCHDQSMNIIRQSCMGMSMHKQRSCDSKTVWSECETMAKPVWFVICSASHRPPLLYSLLVNDNVQKSNASSGVSMITWNDCQGSYGLVFLLRHPTVR